MRVLCYINHYFNPHGPFQGQSARQHADIRRACVRQAILSLTSSEFDITLVVCGIPGHNLVPVDLEFTDLAHPTHLVFASLERMALEGERYDYFLNMEDDIQVPSSVLRNVFAFDRTCELDEVLHPNRMEADNEGTFCVDLVAFPGWSGHERKFADQQLGVARNPHSGLLLLSRPKFIYMRDTVNLGFRGQMEGFPGGPMATAYFNAHQPFRLWRVIDPHSDHVVHHLDRWVPPPASRAIVEANIQAIRSATK